MIGALVVLAALAAPPAEEHREATAHRGPADASRKFTYSIEMPGMPLAVEGPLWTERHGYYHFRLDPGVRLLRAWVFAATDVGSVFEGDFNLWTPTRGLFLRAPHKEEPFKNFEAYEPIPLDYTVDYADPALHVRWVCRVTGPRHSPLTRLSDGALATRCHYGLWIEAQEP